MNSDLISSELIIDDYIANTSKQKVNNTGYKIWLAGGLLNNKNLYIEENSPLALYLLFRANEIRGKMRTPLYKRVRMEYYVNGYIVCALSYKQIVNKTGWYRSKISRYVETLVERRWVRIDKINVGKRNKQNIYILGRLTDIGDDRYFIDEIVNI